MTFLFTYTSQSNIYCKHSHLFHSPLFFPVNKIKFNQTVHLFYVREEKIPEKFNTVQGISFFCCMYASWSKCVCVGVCFCRCCHIFTRALFDKNLKVSNVIQKVINKLVNPVRCYLPTRLGGHKCEYICPVQKIIFFHPVVLPLLSPFQCICNKLKCKAADIHLKCFIVEHAIAYSVVKTILELLLQHNSTLYILTF